MNCIKIKFRIVEDTDYLSNLCEGDRELKSDVEGFFNLSVGAFDYGYYHDDELYPEEQGWYLLSFVFGQFLEALVQLNDVDYAALYDIESLDKWLEIRRHGDYVRFRELRYSMKMGPSIINRPPGNPTYSGESSPPIDIKLLKRSLVDSANNYLESLVKINESYKHTYHYSNVCNLIDSLEG